MTVEGWQLAGAACAVVGGSWAIVQRYFARLEARIDEVDHRQDEMGTVKATLSSHELLDRQQFAEIERRLADMTGDVREMRGSLNARADTNTAALTALKDTVIEMRTELRLRNEIRGMVGRRSEDKPEGHQ